jgi:hypothetical protein
MAASEGVIGVYCSRVRDTGSGLSGSAHRLRLCRGLATTENRTRESTIPYRALVLSSI